MQDDLISPTASIYSDGSLGKPEPPVSGARTPRPYSHDRTAVQQDEVIASREAHGAEAWGEHDDDSQYWAQEQQWGSASRPYSTTGSDSGTEADDERTRFGKALPASHMRLRKGLRAGETNADVLLTPSELDRDKRSRLTDYLRPASQNVAAESQARRAEDDKLRKLRLAEFLRRLSEVACMALITLCVLCGRGVLRTAYAWWKELLCHVVIVAVLILLYPIKLSIVNSSRGSGNLWQRFRVPTSFDPATVLYPNLLPVLVALSLAPANAATIMPNIILGLSSLPQRLFPRSSRLGGINVLHWFITIIPLLVSENTDWLSETHPAKPYMLKSPQPNGLLPETLICLFPLHCTLLRPLQHLTTTSLLASETHLLSAALINLLLLAESPQAVMLKAVLWIGGVSLWLSSEPFLRWNVILLRVPKWRLRKEEATAKKAVSMRSVLLSLLGRSTLAAASPKPAHGDSDADEDTSGINSNTTVNGLLRTSSLLLPDANSTSEIDSLSTDVAHPKANVLNGGVFTTHVGRRSRSNTLPKREISNASGKMWITRRKHQPLDSHWCLELTSSQARNRIVFYAAIIYAGILAVVLIPVRYYVFEKALSEQEPIGWALGYLFGQMDVVRHWIYDLNREDWVAIPLEPASWHGISHSPMIVLVIPSLRLCFGAANTRLLLAAYWASMLAGGLLTVFSLTALVEVDTRRKVFHGVMVAMMLPSTFIDPCACALALTLILAVFLLLEVIRAGQVAPLGKALGCFVAPYVDGRDLRGPVVVSHLFLLVGCAVPLWFSLASIGRSGDLPWRNWELIDETRDVAMVAGVICVGMGDAAASLIGRRYGRHKWIWVGGKSIEGSAAFAVAVTLGLVASKAWLVFGGWRDIYGSCDYHAGGMGTLAFVFAWFVTLAKAVFCACGASSMEAVLTGANDNVVVPVALWLLVKGVRL